jgi:hypothetical protein
MRRWTFIAVAGALALSAALAGPAASAPDAKVASVKLLSCSLGDQSAVFQGRMTRVGGADHMALRYTLLSKLPNQAETRVRVPGLGRWHSSKTGVGTFAFKQQVLNLAAGGAYRVRVEFRWLDAGGAVLRTAKRRSPACRQPAPLPDLRIEISGAKPTKNAGIWRYWLRAGNTGAGSVSNVAVRLSVDGAVVDVETVALLGSGVWGPVIVRGPACESSVDADIDPDGVVAETTETDNHAHVACADVIRR